MQGSLAGYTYTSRAAQQEEQKRTSLGRDPIRDPSNPAVVPYIETMTPPLTMAAHVRDPLLEPDYSSACQTRCGAYRPQVP